MSRLLCLTSDVIVYGEALAGKDISILAILICGAAKCIAGLYSDRVIGLDEQQKLE